MRHYQRPGKRSLALSAGLHVLAIAVAWGAQMAPSPEPMDVITYRINLVSPPPAQEAPEPQPVQEPKVEVRTPEPVVEEKPPPVVEERREEAKPKPTPTPLPPPEESKPTGNPEPSNQVGGEDLNVRMEGLRRDYPEYYDNIIAQIKRCFRYGGGGRFETTVRFYISRDGTVNPNTLDFVERSGNVNFDFAAMGAVECAGSGRFGPLPEELGLDRIGIVFTFEPGGV